MNEVNDVKVLTHFGDQEVAIHDGKVHCKAFPFVVITSNGERELPPPFLRRCVRLDMVEPDEKLLERIVTAHFKMRGRAGLKQRKALIKQFLARRQKGELATDQLLNAIYLTQQNNVPFRTRDELTDAIWKYLSPQDQA